MRALFTLILVTLTALVAGLVGFQAGVASNIGAAGGTVVWHAGYPLFGGFLWFGGFLFFLLFIGLLFAAFAGRRRGPWGGPAGHWGRGPWGYGPMGDPSDPRRQWIAEAHRRLHEEEARAQAPGTSDTDATAR